MKERVDNSEKEVYLKQNRHELVPIAQFKKVTRPASKDISSNDEEVTNANNSSCESKKGQRVHEIEGEAFIERNFNDQKVI